jgi:hypothetical protein
MLDGLTQKTVSRPLDHSGFGTGRRVGLLLDVLGRMEVWGQSLCPEKEHRLNETDVGVRWHRQDLVTLRFDK